MYKIGLTGGIGSGKSTVAKIFMQMDIAIYYADEGAKRLMRLDENIKDKIINLLGKNAYNDDGSLNKKFIASLIFNDNSLLNKLNNIVHPAVRTDFEEWSRRQKSPYVIEESALIFEINSHQYFDDIILIVADTDIRISRIIKRDKTTKKAILNRIKNQLSDEIKISLSDYIISNNGDESLVKQVVSIHKKIIKKL